MRGFSATDSDRNTILVDGLPYLVVRFGSQPTVGTDHVEIVTGGVCPLCGAVQPGGFVNTITKSLPRRRRPNCRYAAVFRTMLRWGLALANIYIPSLAVWKWPQHNGNESAVRK